MTCCPEGQVPVLVAVTGIPDCTTPVAFEATVTSTGASQAAMSDDPPAGTTVAAPRPAPVLPGSLSEQPPTQAV